ncbi:hypothetical protein LB572_17290 [Mesorhizobium sp. BH1-1-5]|uniref:hypothetical protein n=1 Tax=unclassified Mesorhizobium TaxID=325217 RepID=UPI00112BF712|nr:MULTISPECIES: hypothetical protein [unclassified Mesorhizobium]MBZ9988855.1 hypothetical protein [Mesorhizobium sp. BH1-1-5]TPJ61075.1 hypothetical protein FJ471_17985 [Mesorhizobium sp. B2-7-1]
MARKPGYVVPIEAAGVFFGMRETQNGRFVIDLEGQAILSLPGIRYGLALKPGVTKAQAQKLRDLLNELCSQYFAGFLDRVNDEEFQQWLFEGYDIAGYLNPSRQLGPGDEIGRDPFAYDSN